jgi:hypothetical protein
MFKLEQDTQCTVVAQHCRLDACAREVKELKVEIENMSRDYRTLCQEARSLDCRIHEKNQELLTVY